MLTGIFRGIFRGKSPQLMYTTFNDSRLLYTLPIVSLLFFLWLQFWAGEFKASISVSKLDTFFLLDFEQVETLFPDLKQCGISIYAHQVEDILSTHQSRTVMLEESQLVIFPGYLAWETNWPQYGKGIGNLYRQGAMCRGNIWEKAYKFLQGEYDLPGNEPSNATKALSPEQRLLMIDSYPFYDMDAVQAEFSSNSFIWAKLNALDSKWDPKRDISLPPPPHFVNVPLISSEQPPGDLNVQNADYNSIKKKYFLTFKGSFRTNQLRGALAREINEPTQGIVIVDSSDPSSRSWDFKELILNSLFSLVIRGDVEFSYRFTEAVCSGGIPVLLADGWVPPLQSLSPFESYGVHVKESDYKNLTTILRTIEKNTNKIMQLQRNAALICQMHFASVERQVDGVLQASFKKQRG